MATLPFGLSGTRRRLLTTVLGLGDATIVRMEGADAARDLGVVHETRRRAPLLMKDAAALQILACVRAVRRLGGAMAEAGVYAGGSARLICEVKGDLHLHLFDVFETLQDPALSLDPENPAQEVRDYFGRVYRPRAEVERVLGEYPSVHIHAGVFPQSAAALTHESFAFVHLDLDLARGTRDALEFFHPRTLAGGIIVGDDYASIAVRSAFADYFAGRPDTLIELPWSQVVVVKSGAAT